MELSNAVDLPPLGRAAVTADPPHKARPWTEALLASRAVIALSVFVLAALWGAVGYQIRRDADEAIRNAEVALSNLARAFAEHTAKSLEGADQAIRFIRNEYLDHPRDLDIAGYLKNKQIIGAAYRQIAVIGPDGFVSFSSLPFDHVDLRDREHIRVHLNSTQDNLFISKPVIGRVSKKSSLQLTRRVDAADGSFAGVVVVSLSPDYLTRFYSDVDMGPHGVITLVGLDGVVRARATRDGVQGAQDLSDSLVYRAALQHPSGTIRAVSKIDHIARVYAYRNLPDYGLIVLTGAGVDDLMLEPHQRRQAYLISASVMSFVVLAFLAGLVRRERQQLALMGALEASNEQANAANRMKSTLLASVSHELRTPLNGILGYAELIRDGSSDEESREFGAAVHESAQHLFGLVGTLIDLAKIESGRLELTLAAVPLAALFDAARERWRREADAHGLTLEADIAADCPAQIHTDSARLLQVLGQLLDNAIKFSDTGAVRLGARPDPAGIAIIVSDAGTGIAAAQLEALFTRFQGSATEFVHPGQGPGLGLPLCQELMRLLGGAIAVASTPGAGTTVTLRLPLAGPPAQPRGPAHE